MNHMRIGLCCLWLTLVISYANIAGAAQPNILHIHADDFRPDGLGALGNKQVKTPNLDAIVQRGLHFSHCYTQGSMIGAVCLPSRTMMLTGMSWLRIPGRFNAQTAAKASGPIETLPQVMRKAGYQTWHMGKGSNEFKAALDQFETNIIEDAKGPLRAGTCRQHADRAIEFLKQRDAQRPFYIYLAPPVPHDPRQAEPEFMSMYSPADIKLSPAFMPQHPFDNGDMAVRDEQLAPWPRTIEDTQRQLAEYYACISCLDHHMGRVIEQLRATGQLDNTLIVFTGDNGLSMGEHGLFGKQNLYEFGGMHVPLVIVGPGIPHGQRDALVYLMDLMPTFCEVAGASIPAQVEGASLMPIVRGEKQKVRSLLVTGYRDCQRAIRDQRWKLMRYPLVDQTQLFDLQADPLELNNLANTPELAGKVAELTSQLQAEMHRYGDDLPLEVANPKPAAWTPPQTGR